MAGTLLDFIRESQGIEDLIVESRGELTDDLEAQLTTVSLDVAEKVDATLTIMERLEKSAEYWARKAEEYKKIATSIEKARKRMRDHVKAVMVNAGIKELWGEDVVFKLAAHKPKVVLDETVLPELYHKQIVSWTPDLERIRQDLEIGVPVEGAALEPVFSLRDYPNTKAAKKAA